MTTAAHQEPAPRAAVAFEAGSWKVPSCQYVEHLRTALGSLIDLSDYSRRAVERILIARGCALDLNRLLSGKVDLKVRQLLDVCQAIGVHPMELFRLVVKEPRVPSSLVERTTALFGAATPQPALSLPGGSEEPHSQLQVLAQRVDTLHRQVDELRGRAHGSPKDNRHDTPPPPVDRRTAPLGEGLAELAELVRTLRIMAASTSVARAGGRAARPSPPGRPTPGFGEVVAQLDDLVRRLRISAGLSIVTRGSPPGRRT